MKWYLTLVSFLFTTISFAQNEEPKFARFDSFQEFEPLLHINNDTTYVVNFWATWCGPCVKELPYFEELHTKYKDRKLKVVLVSLDFKKQIERKFIPFLKKNEIKSDVVLLLDSKEAEWIDKVDESWSGSIPITLVYNAEKRLFIEDSFHSLTELEDFIKPIFNTNHK